MIRTLRHKQLEALWTTGKSRIDAQMHKPIMRRLQVLDASTTPEGMNVPGHNFHSLNGFNPTRYAVHVNGPWCITFEFEGGNATAVDFEQYH